MQIPSIQEDAAKWSPVLKKICWYVVLASADSDQVTLLNTTAADKKLVELPEYKDLLQTFIVKEVGVTSQYHDAWTSDKRYTSDFAWTSNCEVFKIL